MKPKYIVPLDISLYDLPCWCGSSEGKVLYSEDRWGQPLKTVLCAKCGTIRLNPRMTIEQAAEYYNTIYPAGQYDLDRFFLEERAQQAPNYLVRFLDHDMIILDYGCGPGGKLSVLAEKGYQVYGYDVNSEYREFAYTKGVRPYDPTLKYDCIYLSHTIEHWVNLLPDLQCLIRNNAKNRGLIAIEVPLIDRLLLGNRRNGIQGDVYFVHTWYFSVRSLDKLMGQLRCRRVYTDRVTVCIYRYCENMEPRPVKSTPFCDLVLRKTIDIFSIPVMSKIVNGLNRIVKYVDIFRSTGLSP